jgi:prolyl 4-hydroxylase
VFPDSATQTPREGLSPCVKRGLANVPKRGDLLMFYALTPDGLEDPTSLHGSCPTLKGVGAGLPPGQRAVQLTSTVTP